MSLIGIDFSDAAVKAAISLAEYRNMTSRAQFVVADAVATEFEADPSPVS